jgi:poly(3-hydroxybutyrate) depolymerase
VLHLARRVALGVEVADLLELERAFQRDRVVDPPAQVEEVSVPGERRRQRLDVPVALQRAA